MVVINLCSSTANNTCANKVASVYTPSSAADQLWNNTDSVSAMYRYSSYGKEYGLVQAGSYAHCSKVFEVNVVGTADVWDPNNFETQALSILQTQYGLNTASADVDPNNGFDRYIYLYPRVPSAAIGSAGGQRRIRLSYFNTVSISHELGHTFGLNHSNWLFNEEGTPRAYWDTSSPMGFGGGPQITFNALQRDQLGWLDPNMVVNPFTHGSSAATVTLFPLDYQPSEINPALGQQVVKFKQANQVGTDNYYYVSVRRNEDASGNRTVFGNLAGLNPPGIAAPNPNGDYREDYIGVNIHLRTNPSPGNTSNYIATLKNVNDSQTLKDGTVIRLVGYNAATKAYTITVSGTPNR